MYQVGIKKALEAVLKRSRAMYGCGRLWLPLEALPCVLFPYVYKYINTIKRT